jgi:hypothetical protein
MTDTFTLAEADAVACAATVAQASALPVRLPRLPATLIPACAVAFAASSASWPCVCAAATNAGKFFCTVLTIAVTLADAMAEHCNVTVGGEHMAWNSAWLWQLASQFASTMQLGGESFASHSGAVYATLHPPLQFTLAPHETIAFALSVQLPLQVPLHDPLQWPGDPAL